MDERTETTDEEPEEATSNEGADQEQQGEAEDWMEPGAAAAIARIKAGGPPPAGSWTGQRMLRCELALEEVVEHAQAARGDNQTIDGLKAQRTALGKRINALEDSRDKHIRIAAEGAEERLVECVSEPDIEHKRIHVIRLDCLELVTSREMEPAEEQKARQRELPIQGKRDSDDAARGLLEGADLEPTRSRLDLLGILSEGPATFVGLHIASQLNRADLDEAVTTLRDAGLIVYDEDENEWSLAKDEETLEAEREEEAPDVDPDDEDEALEDAKQNLLSLPGGGEVSVGAEA